MTRQRAHADKAVYEALGACLFDAHTYACEVLDAVTYDPMSASELLDRPKAVRALRMAGIVQEVLVRTLEEADKADAAEEADR